jgi:20S proteasome alpha/beta subunit
MLFCLLLIFTFISTIFSGGVFDTNGKLSQVEFAYQATLKSGTIVASQSKDSIVIVAITPKHFDYTQDTQRIIPLNSNAYICGTGISADVRYLTNKAFESSLEHSATFGSDVPILKMAEDLAEIIHANTFSESIRPYGASLILFGQGNKKGSYEVIELDPLGNMHRCLLSCVGKCHLKHQLRYIESSILLD